MIFKEIASILMGDGQFLGRLWRSNSVFKSLCSLTVASSCWPEVKGKRKG